MGKNLNKTISREQIKNLAEAALQARDHAYTPYSHFAVGAALLTEDGQIYSGCNIENASFGVTNCAERTAFFKAVSEGKRAFTAIAIVGGKEGQAPADYTYPCGICRQVMEEFCAGDFQIFAVKNGEDWQMHRLDELLPCGFGGGSIQ